MLLTLLVCLISALASGSDGTRVLGERVCKDVKPFSALSITKNCNVVYEQGDEYKVRVVAERALLDSIADIADCKVVGDMLVISVKSVNAWFLSSLERVEDVKHGEVFVNGVPYIRVRKNVIVVYVTAPNINRFLCQGSGSLRVDKMDADKVEFFVSGAGSVDIKQLNANDATFHVSGSGSASVDVRCTGTLLCNVSGAGSIGLSGTGEYQDDHTAVPVLTNEEKLTAQQNSFLVAVPSDLYDTSLTEIAALVDKYKLISKRAIYMPIS